MLTARQFEVMALLGQGRTYDEAASELGLTKQSIASHVRYIKVRLGYDTTFALAFGLGLEAGKVLEEEAKHA